MQINNKRTYRFDHEGNRYEQSSLPNISDEVNMNTEINEQMIEENVAETKKEEMEEVLYGLDTERLEQLIRGNEASGNEEDHDESYEEMIQDEDILIDNDSENSVTFMRQEASSKTDYAADYRYVADVEEYSTRSSRMTANADNMSWGNVFFIVCSALATGAVIGYMILILMFGQKIWPFQQFFAAERVDQLSQQTKQTQQTEETIITLPQRPASEQKAASSAPSVTISPLEYTYHLLQHGVFTQADTRDDAIALLQQKGYPAAFMTSHDNKYYLYTGIATTADHMLQISGKLQSVETYRKELTLVLPQNIDYAGSASELESFIQSTNRLISMFADVSAVQFEQISFSPLERVTQQAWKEQYQLWEEQAAVITAGFSDMSSADDIAEIQKNIKLANERLIAYQSKPSAKTLWQVQTAALQAVLAQKIWIDSLN